jgi:hypothetical protein
VKNLIIWSPPSPWPSSSSTTWHGTYHFMSTHLAQWLVPKFHQLSKTKTKAFTMAVRRITMSARARAIFVWASATLFRCYLLCCLCGWLLLRGTLVVLTWDEGCFGCKLRAASRWRNLGYGTSS